MAPPTSYGMSWSNHGPTGHRSDADLLDQAFTRAAGAPLVPGNDVRLLRDTENYPAWLDAIQKAEHKICFENYFIREDNTGREFAEALAATARAGVRVPQQRKQKWSGTP